MAQTNQELNAGREVTATLEAGAVHTYRIRLGNDNAYVIEWEDSDTVSGYADISVGLLREGQRGTTIGVSDSGNIGRNMHRIINAKTNSAAGVAFSPNNWYIIRIEGRNNSIGTYKIRFY